jgi:hypothetical protein
MLTADDQHTFLSSPRAIEICERIATIEADARYTRLALEGKTGLIERVDNLEALRDKALGSYTTKRSFRATMLVIALALLASGVNVWGTLQKTSSDLSEIHAAASQTIGKVAATQSGLDVTNQTAEAAALQREATDSQVKQLQQENVVHYTTIVRPRAKK